MGTMTNVFILHGWTYSTEKWNVFIDLMRKKGVSMHMLNIPGLTEKSDKAWELDDYVEWLRRTIDSQKVNNVTMKQFNNKVILIGHSNGGRIATNFAINYPKKVENLILIDSGGIYHDDFAIRVKRYLFKNIASIGKKLSSSENVRNLLYKIVGESDYKNANPVMRQTMVNLINSDKFLNVNKVTVPTLIIWGREDKITSLSDGKLMSRLIKNSKLHIIDGARHSPQFSHTEIVVNRIYEELTSRHSGERKRLQNLSSPSL